MFALQISKIDIPKTIPLQVRNNEIYCAKVRDRSKGLSIEFKAATRSSCLKEATSYIFNSIDK